MICPFCGEEIKDGAKKCRYCGEFLEGDNKIVEKTEKKEKSSKEKTNNSKGLIQFVIFAVALILSITFSFSTRLFIPVVILVCIRYALCSKKDEKIIDFKAYLKPERYKNIRRIILASVLVILFGRISISGFAGQKRQQKEQARYDAAPTPSIQINSPEGELGDVSTYTLQATIKDATEIIIDGESIETNNGEISKDYTLENPELLIVISAKNEYKSSSYNVKISRNRTEEEQAAYEEEQRIEAEKKAKEEEEKKQQTIANQKEEIGDMRKKLDTAPQSYSSVDGIISTLNLFESAKAILNIYNNSEYNEVKTSRKNLETKLISTQKKLFPILRTEYCKIINDQLRIDDYKVKCNGTTITVIHHSFALNKNISEFHSAVVIMLERLRFKRANYKWVDSSYTEYTYYTMDTPSDGTIQ